MRKKTFLIYVTCFLVTMAGATPLQTGFQNPPTSAKARTWWHWINGNVSKEGITADLEAMKRVGIQEAQIFNVDQGYPEGSAAFLSPEWLELFHFAVLEAKRLELEIGFHNGAGWSSSGGPWITPEFAMQTIVYSEKQCNGGEQPFVKLPQPPTKLGYYKDIAVLAFPTPQNETRLDNLESKTLSGHSFSNHMQPDAKEIPQTALIRKSEIINLTANMTSDGRLKWKVPTGKWTILRIGHTPTATENRPANGTGRGLECDKLSRAAVDAYWKGGIDPIMQKLGPLVGSNLTNCLIDSYEVGCGNWTTGFEKEFAKHCNYDCIAYLPTLAGYYVESGEISERFLWDFRKTIGELMADNYFGYFSELCHKHGMKFSVEPYGGPFNCMQSGAVGDIPMSEFWVGGKVFTEMSKLAASIAHLNGTAEVGAEAFTANNNHSKWLNQPATLKPLGDWAWSEGVNRFIFHTYAHQPWNIAPGMTFHMYGTEISRLNTWWEPGKAYMDYLGRSQFLLQQGRCAADVLVFTGESSPNDGIYRQDIKALGYDYDEIGINKMASLTVKNGMIRTPAGGQYRILVLSENERMTPELLLKLKELAKKGATIVGPKPLKSPSLQKFPQCDYEIKKLADELWGTDAVSAKTALICNLSVKDALNHAKLKPDFSAGLSGSDLLFIHRITDDADIYFISNQQKQYRKEICKFRVTGKQPELWNAETGKIKTIAEWQCEGEVTSIPLSFTPEESFFIVFKNSDEHSAVNDPVVKVSLNMPVTETKVLPDLKIIKAEYGYFLPEGIVDVTDILSANIKENRLKITADNNIVNDPAPGVKKEMRVEYSVDGKLHTICVEELQTLTIPSEGENGELKLIKALYGRFASGFDGNLPELPINVTQQINDKIASRNLIFPVDDRLIDSFLANTSKEGKKLHLIYSVAGELFEQEIPEGKTVNLAPYNPEPKLAIEEGKLTWITPQSGNVVCTLASGNIKKANVKTVPETLKVEGAWDVSFPPNLGAPSQAKFNKLHSWSESSDEGIRYFSGTATYQKQIYIPEEYVRPYISLEIDLGRVCVIAEVIVNGKNLGVLWRAPFRIDLGDAVRAGENDIQIQITNLWVNRLIGDAHYPEDCEWGDWLPKSWPDWLKEPEKRSSKRITFTTWKHWKATDPLQSSGLIGPVLIRPYIHTELSR
ncbi:glycosyl hydrolase [Bacteroides sp.]|uniref:glycosyl hydrolase n=1 Tax=Bacteroides sp. TaxID=29523 RepID=UPI0026155718|nr:glycosyl hydrolase [Bacteroides sp.]MDD3037061.1 glycosyl hydrolase [Bacteroides sp.]